MQSELVNNHGRLLVRLTGDSTPGQWVLGVRSMFDGHMREAARLGCSAVLYDIRGLDLRLSIAELYETGVALAASPCVGIRVACLAREDQVLRDRFLQKVAVNRGATLKVCTTEAEADEWLVGEPA